MSDYLKFLAKFGIGGAHPGGLPLTKEILQNEKIENSMAILDAGCGTGQTAAYLSRKFRCDVTALDYEKMMLEKAAKRFEREKLPVHIVHGSTENLPFDDRSFDLVLSESVTAFTNITKSLEQYARVLKPGGRLLAIEMTKEGDFTSKEEQRVKEFYGVKDVLSEEEWCSKMLHAGFYKVETIAEDTAVKHASLEEISEFKLSQDFELHLFQIWMEHQEIMNRLRERLTYRIYKAEKSNV